MVGSYKSFKIGFNSIINPENEELKNSIHLKVLEINRIVHNTYLFIKSYILHLYEHLLPIPNLTTKFINICFKLFYTPKKQGYVEDQTLLSTLKEYFNNVYSKGEITIVSDCEYIGNFLKYEAIDMLTNYENMINNFKNKFGKPENTLIAFGDWEQKSQMKFKEPTLGKGMRDLFRRNGYNVYLVDEFKTSCTCHVCGGENKKFMKREDSRIWKKNENGERNKVLVHGLLRCTTCKRFWNRDFNASLNMFDLAVNAPFRPVHLSRSKNINHDSKFQ